tara:strand:- start:13363 stop:13566 length:204 start_codon:yes stop_codon:yes gene_type:complete
MAVGTDSSLALALVIGLTPHSFWRRIPYCARPAAMGASMAIIALNAVGGLTGQLQQTSLDGRLTRYC